MQLEINSKNLKSFFIFYIFFYSIWGVILNNCVWPIDKHFKTAIVPVTTEQYVQDGRGNHVETNAILVLKK